MSRQRTCTLVFLFDHERRILKSIADDPDISPRTRRRARALLLTDRIVHPATTDGAVAEETGLCSATIATIRQRYTARGLTDAIRPLTQETDRIEMAIGRQARGAAHFKYFASRRRGDLV